MAWTYSYSQFKHAVEAANERAKAMKGASRGR
jgi:hypothetical protein